MYKKYLNLYNLLITGLLSLISGILILCLNRKFLFFIIYMISCIFMIYVVSNLIKLKIRKQNKLKKNFSIIQLILNTIISIIFLIFPKIPLSMISLIFGIYILFNGLVKLINYIIFKKNHINDRFIELLKFIFYLIFSISCFITPLTQINIILIIIAIYFILIGITYIGDFIRQIIPIKAKNKLKRKIRITLPVFLSVLIPHSILQKINGNINKQKKIYATEKNNASVDLEIFIHVTKDGFGATGHADLYFDNKVFSYGNYDSKSIKLFEAIGDGVLFEIDDKEKYLQFCIKNSKKTIFGFGIVLTPQQKEKIKKQLYKLMKNAYEWDEPINLAKQNNKKDCYAVKLYKQTKAKFYKFTKGKFKTYFVLSTNCVKLVDYVMKATGNDILRTNGIITPGTYYDFLAMEFIKKRSNVVSYKIYK